MTDTITLPRSVVEQAISTIVELEYSNSTAVSDKMARDSKAALRAALEQPQVDQPAMTTIEQRKLDDLLLRGYTISGYSVYNNTKHQHGFVTAAGLVGWWKPEGNEYQQPKVEQK